MFQNKMIHTLNLDQYTDMIPEIYHPGITGSVLNSVAVYDGDPRDGVLVGVIVTQTLGKWLEFVWIKMSGQYKEEVVCADFLRYHMNAAARSGLYDGAFAEIPVNEETEKLYHVFRLARMETRKQRGNVCSFRLCDVSEKTLLKSAKMAPCKSIREASDREKGKILDLIHQDSRPVPMPYGLRWSDYHQDYSMIALENEDPIGLLLTEELEGCIVLELAYTANPKALPAMLGTVLKKLLNEKEKETEILVPSVVKKTDEIVDRLVSHVERGEVIQAVKWFKKKDLPVYARMVMEDLESSHSSSP